MRTLFVYPEFPKTFWSYEKILELVNRKVLLPPLGMCTVAALLPQDWEMKLVDRNVREVTEEEWKELLNPPGYVPHDPYNDHHGKGKTSQTFNK